jgi:hypothetical protein
MSEQTSRPNGPVPPMRINPVSAGSTATPATEFGVGLAPLDVRIIPIDYGTPVPSGESLRRGWTSSSPPHSVGFDDLYRVPSSLTATLRRARELLQQALAHLDHARDMESQNNRLAADEQVMEFRSLLPELLLCAEQNEGMQLIVVASNYAIQNREGHPLTEPQIVEIRYAISRVQSEPFMTFTDASTFVHKMEQCGLQVTPPAIGLFVEEMQAEEGDA